MKLSSAVAEFIAELRMSKAAATCAAYQSDLGQLVAQARPNSVLAFNEPLVTGYFLSLSQQGQGMATLHRKRAAVGEFARWGRRRGLWAVNPIEANPMLRFRRPDPVPRPLMRDEAARLLALPLRGAEAVLRALLYYTGLRVSTICALPIEAWSASPVDLGGGLKVAGTLRAIGKGSRTLIVPVVSELHAALAEWTRARPGIRGAPLVRYTDGRPYQRKSLERMTRIWGEAAQVGDCTPHRFRHTYASDLLERGTDIRVIQRLLGHADIKSTLVYTKVTDAQAFTAVLRRAG